MITSTNLFTTLGALAPTAVSPATRQADDFLAMLQAELGKSGNISRGAPVALPGKPMSQGVPTAYIKPMSLGVPVGLEPPPVDEATKPMSRGVPDVIDPPVDETPKPMSWGVPNVIDPPVDETPKPMSWGAPDVNIDPPVEESVVVVAEESSAEVNIEGVTDETSGNPKA